MFFNYANLPFYYCDEDQPILPGFVAHNETVSDFCIQCNAVSRQKIFLSNGKIIILNYA